jgi:hypothetical protein
MTKQNLKALVKEVIQEMEYPKPDLTATSDQKIQAKLDAWRRWGEKMQQLKQIHQELGVELQKMRAASDAIDMPKDPVL